MHKKVQSLVLAGMISANTLAPVGQIFADEIETKTIIRTISEEKSEDQIYLSDIEYDKSKSSTAYGSIGTDTVHNGNTITLIVDGETTEFKKGMGAHATSTLVYDVSQYKDSYTRLVTYAGVDSRQGNNGNGVKFEIYTSVDGTTWDLVKDLGVLKGNNEAAYVDIELNNANFIKLYAHDNGSKGNDHSVYGDLKLVKDNYSLAGKPIEGLKTVSQYDSELNSNDISANIQNNKMTILKRTLIKRVGYESIQRISAQSEVYSEGIQYLMTNKRALEYFIMGGPVNIGGSYQKSLKAFCEIYAKYKNIMDDSSSDYFNLRLAISIALSHSRDEVTSSWIKSNKGVNPVHRYEVYQYLISSGKMDEGGGNTNNSRQWSSTEFKALSIPMMRWSVDARLNNDEILWMVDYALSEKAKGKNYFDAYNYIVYTMGHNFNNPEYYKEENREKYNDKYNFEEYFNDYGDTENVRMWMVFEEGAVCGGLTQTYSILSDIFGRPSSPCGQPGHAAALTYQWNNSNQRYEWAIQNDISGWVESGNQYDDRMLGWGNQWKNSWSKWHNASYTVLASDAVKDWNNYVNTHYYNLLADSYTDNDMKKSCYKKALELQNINLDAWEGLINCYKAENADSSIFLELAKGVISSYNYYPQTMVELLGYIDDNITDSNHIAQLDILKNNALLRAAQATPKESTNVGMTKQLANHYLNNGQSTELATFSFDGENANKIVLNSRYEDSNIRVRYSFDGGTNWKESNEHIITLTQDELNSITAEDDIQVGLVGTNEVHIIDILAGKTVSNSTIYKNDLENLLIGDVDNLQFSLDEGQTWCDYIGGLEDGIRIEGNVRAKVRYKAHGQYLAGREDVFTFNTDTDTDTRKYVQLKNVKLESYSTQQSSGINHAAANFIDGNANTAWHTRFNYRDPDKHYRVSFDKERYITSLEYTPGGQNGRIKNADVYTSLDGETWVKSGSVTGLANNTSVKTIDLDEATKCKYLTLVPTETYGNSDGERNMYASGKMLNFFEDTTIIDEEIPPVEEEQPPTEEEVPPVEEEPEVPEIPEVPPTEEEPEVPSVPPTEEETPSIPETPEQPPIEEEQPPTEEETPSVPDTEQPIEPEEPSTPDTENPEQDKPGFTHDVIDLVEGDGQENTPYEFIVKRVELDKFNSFLDELKAWSLEFISVTKEGEYTLYNLKMDQKLRNVNDSIYIVLKVKDDQTEILSALNELGKELHPPTEEVPPTDKPEEPSVPEVPETPDTEEPSTPPTDKPEVEPAPPVEEETPSVPDTEEPPVEEVPPVEEEQPEVEPETKPEEDKFEEVLDGTANDDMMVAPETETPSVDGGVTTDKDDTTNNSNTNNGITGDTVTNGNTSNNTANGTTNNPTTGDVGIVGYVGLGLASVLGLFKNRRKRK